MAAEKKLLDRMRETIRLRHYSKHTEGAYTKWVKRYILFHNKKHPKEMGALEIRAFLSNLAIDKNVATSTQKQARNAIQFLYREVLEMEIDLDKVENCVDQR